MKTNDIITLKDGSMLIRPLNQIFIIESSGKVKALSEGQFKEVLKVEAKRGTYVTIKS